MHQMNPRLQSIYNIYYTENPKDFIELIEIISQNGLNKIENIIKELERISSLGVNTEKIKLLCNRNQYKMPVDRKKETIEIEKQSKLMLNHYASILNSSVVAFDEDVAII